MKTTISELKELRVLYPVPLMYLLFAVLLCTFVFSPVSVTLDGYSHLYGARALTAMLRGEPHFHENFSYNSPFQPVWLGQLLLAALSSILPSELALKLFIVLTFAGLLASLYFCCDAKSYSRRQRSEAVIVLIPFALNGFLTLGFYSFLISTSMCLLVLGLILRHGLEMPLRLQLQVAGLLLVAYCAHPLPVMVSCLFPAAHLTAESILRWRDGWRSLAAALKLHVLYSWPWVPVLCAASWFYLRLASVVEPGVDHPAYSLKVILKDRFLALAKDAVVYFSPSSAAGTAFVALLSILLCGIILGLPSLVPERRLGFLSLSILAGLTTILYLVAPEHVGDGSDIANRFLMYSALFLVVLALNARLFNARILTVCSVIAALLVCGFAAEYIFVSTRMAPGIRDLTSVMEGIPSHSRILILGYRMTPACKGFPLRERTIPERHWALAGALKHELIVLNDYESSASHFPLKYVKSRFALINEVDFSSEKTVDAWVEDLEEDREIDFVLSWGAGSGISACGDPVAPPLEQALSGSYNLVAVKEGSCRVQLWKRRDAPALDQARGASRMNSR